jgi:hypothetical protein
MATEMGSGSSDNTQALWVFQDNPGTPNPMPDFIAYPPKGYMPAPLVYDRWSFGKPGASFSNANVEMWDEANNPVSLSIIEKTQTGVGDNSIVWEPSGINTSSPSDVKYKVTVSNITGSTPSSFTYEVIIFKPTKTMETGYERIRRTQTDYYLGEAPLMD